MRSRRQDGMYEREEKQGGSNDWLANILMGLLFGGIAMLLFIFGAVTIPHILWLGVLIGIIPGGLMTLYAVLFAVGAFN